MYHFIINPDSQSGKGLILWKKIRRRLDELEVSYHFYITSRSHDATKIAEEITMIETENTRIITVLGGDGTLNEVINGISSFYNILLGFIPVGSSNDFARSLHLSTEPLEALEHILNPKHYKTIDYGVLSSDRASRNFIVSSGIGYDASVCSAADTSPFKNIFNKISLGKFTYAMLGIRMLFRYKPVDAYILLDHGKKISVKNMLFASIHNQKYEGGGFMFCPNADNTDNLLDICVVENISRLKILFLLPLAFLGKHVYFKEIKNYRCKTIELTAASPLPVHTDGESFKKREYIHASCAEEKICIITG